MSKKKPKPKTKYSFHANRYLPAEVKRIGAEVVGREIEKVTSRDGIVDKAELIKQARPVKAPLHPCFEWNDPKAADLYRQYQARNIVNAVTVKIEGHDISAFPSVSVKVESEDGARRENIRVENMLDDAELRQQKINEVMSRLMRLRQEYQSLNELSVVWRAIDQVKVG